MYVPDLVYDVGLHKGEDAEYFMKKGFRVVAFEANPTLVEHCSVRFAKEISSQRIVIVSGAISSQEEQTNVKFYKNALSVWGTVVPSWDDRNRSLGAESEVIEVPHVRMDQVIKKFGMPYYMKIDIEGMDTIVLDALKTFDERPEYLSIEAENKDFNKLELELQKLVDLGYRRFKAVQQAGLGGSSVDGTNCNGLPFRHTFSNDTSGPFGNDLSGPWLSIDEIRLRYQKIFVLNELFGDNSEFRTNGSIDFIHKLEFAFDTHVPGWFDTHATR